MLGTIPPSRIGSSPLHRCSQPSRNFRVAETCPGLGVWVGAEENEWLILGLDSGRDRRASPASSSVSIDHGGSA